MIRRYGEAVHRDKNYRIRRGSYAILHHRSKVLLTLQHGDVPEFQLPGGGIDPGESPVQALYREVIEETGWTIARPRMFGAFRRFVYMPEYALWAEKVCLIYTARPVRKLAPPTEPDHMAIWCDFEQTASLLSNPGDAAMMKRYRHAQCQTR